MSLVSNLDNSINGARKVLTDSIFTSGNAMYNVAEAIGTGVRPIAITLLGLFFVIEFLKIITHNDILKWQTGFKIAAKLVMAYVALDISSQLTEAIYSTGGDLINNVVSHVGGLDSTLGAAVKDKLDSALNGLGFLEAIGFIGTIGIAFIVVWIIGVVIMVLAYARSIELLMHIAIAPIPCAFLLLEDRHSRIFWKFIMSFAANCLQGFFIVLSIALYNALVEQIYNTMADNVDLPAITGALLLGTIVLLVTVVKSGTLAKQILDV